MDYVQSVLARQQRLLSLLLLGGGQEMGREKEQRRQAAYAGPGEQGLAEQVLAGNMAGPVKGREEGVLWREETAGGAAELSPVRALSAARFDPSGAGGAWTAQQAADVRTANDPRRQMYAGFGAVQNGGKMAEDGVRRGPGGMVESTARTTAGRALAPLSTAGGTWQEEVSPQAVSLAFQRDARRYDGGFSLY